MQKSAKPRPESTTSDIPDFFNVQESLTKQSDSPNVSVVGVSEAAKLLGITERSVWRRIRQKKLSSRLKDGRTLVSVPVSVLSLTDSETSVTTSIEVNDVLSDGDERNALALIAKQAEKLEGATYRIGFLESELAAAREQTKLIPDLQKRAMELEQLQTEIAKLTAELEQQKQTPWNRFVNWLTVR